VSAAGETAHEAPADAYRTAAVVGPGGTVTLSGVPFDEGVQVEVVVVHRAGGAPPPADGGGQASLRGSVLAFDGPTAPVWPADPEAGGR
jgi:hypothetical protein